MGDTRHAARGWRAGAVTLAALHRDEVERAVQSIYLLARVILAEGENQLAKSPDRAAPDPFEPGCRVRA